MKEPMNILPKGVFTIFYDEKGKEATTLKGNYAIRFEKSQRMEIKYNVTFPSVTFAYEIFDLTQIIHLSDKIQSNNQISYSPWYSIKNNSNIIPTIGAILLWENSGNFMPTGHVAIITNIIDNWICIVEQNNENTKWTDKVHWSRQLLLTHDNINDIYTIHETNGNILGWKIF